MRRLAFPRTVGVVKGRVATAEDLQRCAQTLTDGFAADPVWSWAFPDRDRLEVWWRFWVGGALPQGWVRVVGDADSVAVWIPPSGHECAPEDEPHVEALVRALAGERAPLVLGVLDRFERNHPRTLPHYYLSLLATADRARGRGVGMELLAESLALIDVEGAAAYLESSNPANLSRYEGVGFRAVGEFMLPDGVAVVTTMWRDPR
jgi:ribosomal protein S18 acetylase RimI-like enzyme